MTGSSNPNMQSSQPAKRTDINKVVAIGGIILTVIGLCIAVAACIVSISVPEIRDWLGLKSNSDPVTVVLPTDAIEPTATLGPCSDFMDVRFVNAPQFFQEPISTLENTPPSGEYMVLLVEYMNLQSQPIEAFYWDQTFKVAGQFDTATTDFVYYSPNYLVTSMYTVDHDLVAGCPDDINPGMWYSCYMVFDVDPALKNMFLVIQNDYGEYQNICTTYWKIPVDGR